MLRATRSNPRRLASETDDDHRSIVRYSGSSPRSSAWSVARETAAVAYPLPRCSGCEIVAMPATPRAERIWAAATGRSSLKTANVGRSVSPHRTPLRSHSPAGHSSRTELSRSGPIRRASLSTGSKADRSQYPTNCGPRTSSTAAIGSTIDRGLVTGKIDRNPSNLSAERGRADLRGADDRSTVPHEELDGLLFPGDHRRPLRKYPRRVAPENPPPVFFRDAVRAFVHAAE